jgi:hypothetical protein
VTISETGQALTLGQYVTVSSGDDDRGTVYVGVRQDARTLLLHPVVGAHPHLQVAQEVRCSSVAGQWSTTIRAIDDGVLELAVPAWVSRSARRNSIRVPSSLRLEVGLGTDTFSGRLRDLSAGGASVLVERHVGLARGRSVTCLLPAGPAGATIRSVRPHDHPLLCVVGLSWQPLDAACTAWVASEVADAATRRFRRAT